ncbi:ABC transporter ATP-binding protein [Rheinheimera sp. F8]|uniref:ABC transporter ATP-binding protein n=1 Tax=Rheinheimera sp. F8 TaxID=1763998 RepID=UPI000744AF1A|nr:ABC transporter ATP-binding protein [Rheinheimera sp. F8]ALZ75031.1 ABC transporter ATP-binding protein [Rheinheimera sp. F8]ALZ76543.1 ABC transporter ATP-binding protein [Rheinheimera sp. F8]
MGVEKVSSAAPAVLAVSQLCKSYGALKAVNNLSFSVQAGQCFGLLGPNGAGKTTTLEMLEGIIKPDSGSIFYHGEIAGRQHFQQLGVQFQQTALQDFLTVEETLRMFAAFYPQPADIQQLIRLCDLGDFLTQDHKKLSGGQRQRLLLALALVNQPQILFLDEPTTGLDPHARRNFWTLIKQIKQQGRTIILTTHYMDEAEQLCDDLIIVDKGQIIAQGAPQALLRQHFEGALLQLPDPGFIPSLPDGHHASLQGGQLCIQTPDVQHSIQALLQQQVPLQGLLVKSATLDDLFLKLTGHALSGVTTEAE